ncbi:MAG: hypothetical protein RMK20_03250 [Verrucomicrobiales bacterium]|nr:hypothetical protein [Verrucomicrobiales bacterium]
MSNCLAESELQLLSNEIVRNFERRVAAIPEHLCAPFHTEARQLEAELLLFYKFVALAVRKEEDLDRIAKAWAAVVRACDESAQRLHGLAQRHPDCGADVYYDRVLDHRNKCRRLQEMHS